MNTSPSSSLPVFAELAAAFCHWCESGSFGGTPERAISSWFARLYAGGLMLAEIDGEDDAPDAWAVDTSAGELTIAPLRGYYYREIFNPQPGLDEEPCVGDVGDDLLDTYKDIKRGLALFESGFPRAAEWEWAFHFRVHWGRHTAGGLLALHCMAHSSLAEENAP